MFRLLLRCTPNLVNVHTARSVSDMLIGTLLTVLLVDCTFRDQFTYCHALHRRRAEVDRECDLVCTLRDEILMNGRLGNFTHAKPHKVNFPEP